MKPPLFDHSIVQDLKADLVDGERLCILCSRPQDVEWWRAQFTLEELERISFEYPTPSQERR